MEDFVRFPQISSMEWLARPPYSPWRHGLKGALARLHCLRHIMKPRCDPKRDPKGDPMGDAMGVDSCCLCMNCALIIVIDSSLERWMRSQLNLTIHIFQKKIKSFRTYFSEIRDFSKVCESSQQSEWHCERLGRRPWTSWSSHFPGAQGTAEGCNFM